MSAWIRSTGLAALLALATAAGAAGEARLSFDELIDLSGPWQALPGDDPAYSSPDLDTSAWLEVELPQPASDPRIDVQEVAWFRKELRFQPPPPGGPALGFFPGRLSGSFEVYADGRLLGSHGSVVPATEGRFTWPSFELPRELLADGRLVVAVRHGRAHWGQRQAVPRFTRWGAPIVGPLTAVQLASENFETRFALQYQAPLFTMMTVLGLIGLYHVYLFRRRRELEVYLYYGLGSLFYTAAYVPRFFVFNDVGLVQETSLRVFLLFVGLFFVVQVELLHLFLLGRRPGRIARGFQAWFLLSAGADFLFASRIWPVYTGAAWAVLGVGGFTAVSASVLVRSLAQGTPNAVLVGVGGLLSCILGLTNSLSIFGVLPPLPFSLEPLIFAPFILAMAIALARHFTTTLDELDESERSLERKVEERTAELSDINEVARTVNATLDLDRVLATVHQSLGKIFRFDQLGVFLLDEAGARLRLDRMAGDDFDEDLARRLRSEGIPFDEERSVSVLAVREHRNVFVPQISAQQVAGLSPSDRAIYERNPMQGLLICPLEVEGAVIGTLFITNTREPFDIGEEDVATIQRYVTTLATALKNARLLAQAESARGEAEEANRTKSQFLANMSHELRTPLNAIIGYSEMLQEEARDDGNEDYVPDLGKILGSGRYLLELINGVLDLAKIESGKMELYLEDFDVAELVRGVEGTLQPLVRQNQNTLEVQGLEGLGSMHGDVTKLRQMLFNLLSNASKFTKEGTIRLEATRGNEEGEDWLVFRVSDTGIGMDADQLDRVFDEFSQADASTTREYGGTGLGLPITKKFAEMLGGSIHATSEPGQGSTFEIRLPARAPAPAASGPEAGAAAASSRSAPGPAGRTVLVIDDDPAARDLVGRFLIGEGFGVLTAATGQEGLRLARERRPDLVTLDVLMPGTDGWSVLGELKADPELGDIPVILISITDDRNLGYALGASEYLTKPVDWDRLGAVLRRYAGDGSQPLALVIDDESEARRLLRRGLEKAGWQVAEAENGRVGLERLAEARPRIILLDLMMPELDGFGFVAALRENEAWRSIPVLVLTAKEVTAEDRARLEGGVSRILAKGSTGREELAAEIRRLVGEGEARVS